MKSLRQASRSLPLLLSIVLGCSGGGYSGPTGTLAGKVSVGGQPVAEGTTVQVIHQQMGYAASARINAEGSYAFGPIPVGKYDIGFAPQVSGAASGSQDPDELMKSIEAGTYEAPDVDSAIPEKLRNPSTSGESVDVAEGANQRDFNL